MRPQFPPGSSWFLCAPVLLCSMATVHIPFTLGLHWSPHHTSPTLSNVLDGTYCKSLLWLVKVSEGSTQLIDPPLLLFNLRTMDSSMQCNPVIAKSWQPECLLNISVLLLCQVTPCHMVHSYCAQFVCLT